MRAAHELQDGEGDAAHHRAGEQLPPAERPVGEDLERHEVDQAVQDHREDRGHDRVERLDGLRGGRDAGDEGGDEHRDPEHEERGEGTQPGFDRVGRCRIGTSQTLFMAFCMAWTTPRPAQMAATTPMTMATALPRNEPTFSLICRPTTGSSATVESTIRRCSSSLPRNTNPWTLVIARSSGKIEKKP